jgi:hypothetical protein
MHCAWWLCSDTMSNYSHMFKSRIRFFSRVLGCLYTVLPGVLPAKMKPISDEVRMASIMRMKVYMSSPPRSTLDAPH